MDDFNKFSIGCARQSLSKLYSALAGTIVEFDFDNGFCCVEEREAEMTFMFEDERDGYEDDDDD